MVKKKKSIIDTLRKMNVGDTEEFDLCKKEYIRLLISDRLCQERADGMMWETESDKVKMVLHVMRTQ